MNNNHPGHITGGKTPNNRMMKIGITVDDYKLKRFEEELATIGHKDLKVVQLPHNTKLIQIKVKEEDFDAEKEKIRRLCVRLEHHFRRAN